MRPRLFSFFARAPHVTPDASAFIAPPVAVAGITSEPGILPISAAGALKEMTASITDLTAKLAGVTAERDMAISANGALSARVTEYQAQCTDLEAAIVTLKETLAGLTTERDTLKAEASRTRADLTQEIRNTELATLAASQGVPACAEIVPANGPGGKSKSEELEEVLTEMKAAVDPGIRGTLAAKAKGIRDAIRSGK